MPTFRMIVIRLAIVYTCAPIATNVCYVYIFFYSRLIFKEASPKAVPFLRSRNHDILEHVYFAIISTNPRILKRKYFIHRNNIYIHYNF